MKKMLPALVLGCLWAGPLPAQSAKPDPVARSVARALKYLQKVQDGNGSWHLNQGPSPGATSLAVMAFLSAGHVPGEGPYGDTIVRGIRWVLSDQKPDGTFTSWENPSYAMYEQGITTLMLAEVAGMTDAELSPRIKRALEKSVAVILKAQRSQGSAAGGWRYKVEGVDADLSVTGWQLLALRAARNLGCDVPVRRIDLALDYIKRCEDARTGGYCYLPGSTVTFPCTGTAILCLELCHKHHCPEALRAGAYLLQHQPRWEEEHFFYSAYYCSQATFQLGGNYWDVYRPQLLHVLSQNQLGDGSWGGRDAMGTTYGTAMSVLALTVEYRYLPIYQRGEDQVPPRGP